MPLYVLDVSKLTPWHKVSSKESRSCPKANTFVPST